jgi:hypothetical protein
MMAIQAAPRTLETRSMFHQATPVLVTEATVLKVLDR